MGFVLIVPGIAASGDASVRAKASSSEANLVVYAPDPATADFTILEAERAFARFNRLFNLSHPKKSASVVVVVGDSEENRGDRGVVRVFRKTALPKIQVNWGETPILLDAFQRAWIRALCVRQALSAMEETQRHKAELRVPIWVTEGVAALAAEPNLVAETLARASLLARTEPNLPFDEMVAELEGNTQLDLNGRSLAAVLCRALIQAPAGRDRFFRELNWSDKWRAGDWVRAVGEVNDPAEWWRGVWASQAAQASWLKLGYAQTLRHALTLDRASDNMLLALKRDIASVAHPWFQPLFARKFSGVGDEERTSSLIADLQQAVRQRHATALAWFCDMERAQPPLSCNELLGWRLLQLDRGEKRPPRGPAENWFESLFQKTAD